MKYWLEFGTLLGKVRDNNFIGHDINFDIGIMRNEITPNFLLELEESNFKKVDSLKIDNKIKNIRYLYEGIEVEIFLFEREDDKKVVTYCKNLKNEFLEI